MVVDAILNALFCVILKVGFAVSDIVPVSDTAVVSSNGLSIVVSKGSISIISSRSFISRSSGTLLRVPSTSNATSPLSDISLVISPSISIGYSIWELFLYLIPLLYLYRYAIKSFIEY